MPKEKTTKLDTKELWVYKIDIKHGCWMYICRHTEYGHPLGFVWGIPHYTKKEYTYSDVCGSYVTPWARRNGIRTLINNKILEMFQSVVSPNGTKEGGEAFMKAFGYKKDKLFGWRFDKPKKKKRKLGRVG